MEVGTWCSLRFRGLLPPSGTIRYLVQIQPSHQGVSWLGLSGDQLSPGAL